MAAALVRHDELIAGAVESHGGRFLKSKGEGTRRSPCSSRRPTRCRRRSPRPARSAPSHGRTTGRSRSASGSTRRGRAARRRLLRPGRQPRGARARAGRPGEILLSQLTADLTASTCRRVLARRPRPPPPCGRRLPGVTATSVATRCPYRGLLAFDADDRAFFFGRESRARLDHRAARAAPARARGSVGQREVLAAARRPDRVGRPGRCPGWRARLVHPGARPPAIDGDAATLVVVDQFEELYTLCGGRAAGASSTRCSPTRDRWRSACGPTSTAS